MTAFEPYDPLNIPKPFGDGIWIIDGPEIAMDFPLGLKVHFPTRMVIVQLADGRLWVHSPIAPDDGLVEAVRALGDVAVLVAPNSIHYWYMPEWQALFPAAECHYAPGIAERAEGRKAMPEGALLTDHAPATWADQIDQLVVPGPVVSEAIFHHRASRTVILVDLIENFEPARMRSWFWRIAGRFAGVVDPDGKAPADYRATFRKNRAEVAAKLAQVISWDPVRVVMAHGRPYSHDGAQELRRSFRWAIKGGPNERRFQY